MADAYNTATIHRQQGHRTRPERLRDTQKAADGLFLLLANEEKMPVPLARTTDL